MSGIAYGLVGDGVKQAFLEAETSVNTYAPPDLIKHSPGVAKAYGVSESNGTLASGSYNVTGVATSTTGVYTWTWDTNFADADYSLHVSLQSTALNAGHTIHDSYTTGTARILIYEADGSIANEAHHVVAFGSQ